jgi:hypothetical protein
MKGRLTAYDRCPHLVADDAAIYAIVPLAPDRRFPRSLLFRALVEVWRSARNTLVSAALVDGRNPFVMPHKRRSWLRSIAVGIAIFVAWFAIAVLFYQESPGDKPPIVSLLTREG